MNNCYHIIQQVCERTHGRVVYFMSLSMAGVFFNVLPGSEPLTAGLALVIFLSDVNGGGMLLQFDPVGKRFAAVVAHLESGRYL